MPPVLRVRGYRFFFFSAEGREPRHIHVEKGEGYAKFWLDPVLLARSRSFSDRALTEIEELVRNNVRLFQERWDEHFSG